MRVRETVRGSKLEAGDKDKMGRRKGKIMEEKKLKKKRIVFQCRIWALCKLSVL